MNKWLIAGYVLLCCWIAMPTSTRVLADTGEQNTIEGICMFMLLSDYAHYGVVPLAAHFEAYVVCGVTWWVSWLPDQAQALWWRWQYAYALDVLTNAK